MGAANNMETKMMIASKMQGEAQRQERLRQARETCLPCSGTWPNCHCGQDVEFAQHKPILKTQVTRKEDEADGVDQTLPRNDTIKSQPNYGKPALGIGSICTKGDECNTGICAGGHCCTSESNGCSDHGVCNEAGNCLCAEGWFGVSCAMDHNGTKAAMNAKNFSAADMKDAGVEAKTMDELKDAIASGNATLLKEALTETRKQDPKRVADQEYAKAVGNFSDKIDSMGRPVDVPAPKEIDSKETRAQMETQAVSDASFAKLKEQELVLETKKTELKRIVTQHDGLTDPNAKAKLRNAAENMKNEIQLIEARIAGLKDETSSKNQRATETSQTLAADLSAQAAKAKAAAEVGIENQKRLDRNSPLGNAVAPADATGAAGALK